MNKRRSILAISLIFVLVALPIFGINAQEMQGLEVTEMTFCMDVQDREPVGADSVFADTVKTVYCFTSIAGAEDTTTVTHVWYHDGEEMAEVELTIAGDPWRTWSSKRIMVSWTGEWRVDVVSMTGDVIRSKTFMIESTGE